MFVFCGVGYAKVQMYGNADLNTFLSGTPQWGGKQWFSLKAETKLHMYGNVGLNTFSFTYSKILA